MTKAGMPGSMRAELTSVVHMFFTFRSSALATGSLRELNPAVSSHKP